MTVRPRAVLFDLDSTLYDVRQYLRGAFADIGRALAAYGAPEVLEAVLTDLWGRRKSRMPGLFDAFAAACGIPMEEVPRMVAAYRRHDPVRLEPWPDAREVLDAVDGIAVGLITNGDGGMQRRKVRALGLEGRFRPAVFAGDGPRALWKPDPTPFRRALDELGLPASDVFYVGDDPRTDVPGAIAAGMTMVRLRRGEYEDEATPEGAIEILDLREIFPLLRGADPVAGGA
ncbi:MAG: HAD family hydrolase [Planctomycetes bacterium]|nr:HAD family hydrolase [Planctomycetota bacterium]